MSMNSRYRERKYNTSDNDRLLRALSQPVQAWDKKWTQHSNSKTLQTYKWVKSERTIEYEQDEESEEEPEPMETEPSTESAPVEVTTNIHTTEGTDLTTTTDATTTTTSVENHSSSTTTTTLPNSQHSEQTIPGGTSTLLTNKTLSTVQQEMEEDDRRSETPKLDDISDDEVNTNFVNEEDSADNMNDASKHPALAPHAQAHLSEEEERGEDDVSMTDSATPQTEGNTPMPPLDEDDMEHTNSMNAHPLSQEILTGVPHDMASLNNDSPAVQTPEDVVSHHD